MRYALRNQKKIEAAYPGMIQRILDSLKSYFEKNESIELFDSGEESSLMYID